MLSATYHVRSLQWNIFLGLYVIMFLKIVCFYCFFLHQMRTKHKDDIQEKAERNLLNIRLVKHYQHNLKTAT